MDFAKGEFKRGLHQGEEPFNISYRIEFSSRIENPKINIFSWFGPLPVMTSSPLIRLQRPLPPSSGTISKNENRTLSTVFYKLFKNIFFDFRFKNFFTSGLIKRLLLPVRVDSHCHFFTVYLEQAVLHCHQKLVFLNRSLRSQKKSSILALECDMTHDDVIIFEKNKIEEKPQN